MERAIKVKYYGLILIDDEYFQLSAKETSKGFRCYLHHPSKPCFKYNEISKELFLTFINMIRK